MNAINTILTQLAGFFLSPFASRPLLGLLFWSVVAGVLMTFAFGKTSSQQSLKRAADQTRSELLAIKLFKDDLGVVFRSQIGIFKATGLRLFHSLPPMLVLIIPFVLILSQLGLRYENRPFLPGEIVLVELSLSESSWNQYRNVKIKVPAHIVVETEAMRDEYNHAVYWRLRSKESGHGTLTWTIGGEDVKKQIIVADDPNQLVLINARRPGTNLLDRLLYAGEPAFGKDSSVRSIGLDCQKRSTQILGLNFPWWGTFFVVSMVSALLVRRLLGVQF